ncbi:hypothetical protein A3F29_04410 [Candidatus Roizmanbacteria bacterium RIFCSPHIGHO2_12_FULL_33_9]|uniref:Chromate transporter n=1 Tax=Candidatus Roizmanbacteria bacterium RIFCSPHIGHO2_12_FULL_33_9 TaxID=1802045 RepID=A0A1F7HIC3_9BACT|nr:MAG: hypothetical protein A3F29_04410 [Candidatus Roizmanbacteria bacterium RIFCSPHIGHO2_12_FULL_33_9]
MADKKMDFNSILSQLEDTLELYLVKKAPNLPKTIKDLIVVLTPWFTLLGIIFSIPLVFVAFGLSTLIGPLSVITGPLPAISYGAGYTFAMLILAFALVLDALAIPGLFKRQIKGWKFIYWATLVSFVSNIFSFNLFGGIIGTLVSLYFIFQIKSYYK